MRSGGKLLGLMALLTLCGFTISACAQQRILWQIGKFNHSSREFRTEGVNYNSPESNVVYTIALLSKTGVISSKSGVAARLRLV
jgi:hypothetical protein